MEIYSESIELISKKFYASLREIDKRRFAGLEAEKLGRGGKTFIHKLF